MLLDDGMPFGKRDATGNSSGGAVGDAQSASGSVASANDRPGADISRFSDLYYYEADKLDRYLAYEAAHPELSPGAVVWRVDAKLDKPFYSDVAIIEKPDMLPVLANKYNKFPDDFAPSELVDLRAGVQVTPETKEAFLGLAAAAKTEGFTIRAGSAYRTIAYQKSLYDRYKKADGADKADTYSSRPGHSEHHTGRTLDLVAADGTLQNFRDTPEAGWVAENAWRFGFIVRYTQDNEEVTGYGSEPWHLTYVGKTAAAIMRGRNIGSLEEYFVKYVYHKQPH
jgi:D-alanyl-D-alanine carboxypeptidase